MSKFHLISIFTIAISSLSFGHARLTTPTPRNNNAGIKVGPCGGLARTATPTPVMGGKMLTVAWEETINHPGRFIFSLSTANDTNFQQNVLATIVDAQDQANNLPHKYTAQIPIPDIDCPTCTLQLIQSMEENPAAPTYYYSCADIVIQKSVATPTPTPTPSPGGGETTQSSTSPGLSSSVKYGQGGCGLVKAASDTRSGPGGWGGLLILTIPLAYFFISQRRYRQPN